MTGFAISDTPFDVAPLRRRLLSPAAGAYASFEGWVRDHHAGRAVRGLVYEAYVPLAEAEGARIVAQARARFAIVDAACVHRTGELVVGELAVWVGASAGHRGPAFDACRWIIDEVKARVPIWKREHYADATTAWIHPGP